MLRKRPSDVLPTPPDPLKSGTFSPKFAEPRGGIRLRIRLGMLFKVLRKVLRCACNGKMSSKGYSYSPSVSAGGGGGALRLLGEDGGVGAVRLVALGVLYRSGEA